MPVTLAPAAPDSAQQAARRGGAVLAGGLIRYVLALLYGLALCYAYEVLSVWWAYFGFSYKLNDAWLRYGACLVAALPAVLLDPRPRTFAQASAWFLYVLVFLPCLLVPVMQFSSDADRLGAVFSATFAGCVLFMLLVRGDIKRRTVPMIGPRLFWTGLAALWIAMLVLISVSFGGSFQLVGADDIYNQRFTAGNELTGNPLVRYSIALLGTAIDPFLIAVGLHTRRYWISGAGVAGQIFLFGTLAARATLLSPLFVVGAYFLSDRRGGMSGNRLLLGLLVLFAATSPLLVTYNPLGGGLNQLTTLLYLRTLLISGAAFGVYEQFFGIFPLTYFSNSNIVGQFIDYPYGNLSIGQAVLQFLVPISGPDIGELNANFLATDGMASLGVLGVIFASGLTALVLRLISSVVVRARTMLMVASGTGFMLSLANTSLLTSLVTGGGLLLTALVCLAPLADDDIDT